ncbi:HNH endonuclease signature motif containing protein [Glycomyces sp. YM15]|uniref:HNH endonuclease signature motif containing protein n=1 Tax=Glycomyces sp. YM15 TaxID=2800446 RepID=UPI001964A758|nr:HNH endonuclease signature motif containing protein [Glycomyces sp. YM15]
MTLRHKLELEQPGGCAWAGCRAPISWTEAHHLEHWADGGSTTAENLILLCRFHHGRIHTGKWDITKTGPGQVVIRHRRTGAADAEWEADADLPNGQAAEAFSRSLKRQLDEYASGSPTSAWKRASREPGRSSGNPMPQKSRPAR